MKLETKVINNFKEVEIKNTIKTIIIIIFIKKTDLKELTTLIKMNQKRLVNLLFILKMLLTMMIFKLYYVFYD